MKSIHQSWSIRQLTFFNGSSKPFRYLTILELSANEKKSIRYRTKYTRDWSQEYNSVQKSGDSREFASHTAYRGLLRPSSLRESSHPSLRVFSFIEFLSVKVVSRNSLEVGLFVNRNDPSAGSPTDTVLRLLHPLDDKAHDTSFRSAMREQSDSPCSLPDHPIGWSDGRCVQRAGT